MYQTFVTYTAREFSEKKLHLYQDANLIQYVTWYRVLLGNWNSYVKLVAVISTHAPVVAVWTLTQVRNYLLKQQTKTIDNKRQRSFNTEN